MPEIGKFIIWKTDKFIQNSGGDNVNFRVWETSAVLLLESWANSDNGVWFFTELDFLFVLFLILFYCICFSSRCSVIFFCAIFSRLFRLSLASTICPWVSEDDLDLLQPRSEGSLRKSLGTRLNLLLFLPFSLPPPLSLLKLPILLCGDRSQAPGQPGRDE